MSINFKYKKCPYCHEKLEVKENPYDKTKLSEICPYCKKVFHSWNKSINIDSLPTGIIFNDCLVIINEN